MEKGGTDQLDHQQTAPAPESGPKSCEHSDEAANLRPSLYHARPVWDVFWVVWRRRMRLHVEVINLCSNGDRRVSGGAVGAITTKQPPSPPYKAACSISGAPHAWQHHGVSQASSATQLQHPRLIGKAGAVCTDLRASRGSFPLRNGARKANWWRWPVRRTAAHRKDRGSSRSSSESGGSSRVEQASLYLASLPHTGPGLTSDPTQQRACLGTE